MHVILNSILVFVQLFNQDVTDVKKYHNISKTKYNKDYKTQDVLFDFPFYVRLFKGSFLFV